jgi:SAM-dependent methyltransferase
VAKAKGLKKLVLGTGTSLPFKDESFSCTYFVTSLEFILDRRRALLEAARVSREKVVVAFLNKYSLLNLVRSIKALFKETTYSKGSFLSKDELVRLARAVGESSPFSLKFESFSSTLNFSIDGLVNRNLEEKLGFNLPFGAFGVIKFKVVRRNGAGKRNRL